MRCRTAEALPFPADAHLYFHRISHSSMLEMFDRVGGNQVPPIDDDDFSAYSFHFGQDMGAEDDRVLAGKALDQLARFGDLFRIETRSRFVQNQIRRDCE